MFFHGFQILLLCFPPEEAILEQISSIFFTVRAIWKRPVFQYSKLSSGFSFTGSQIPAGSGDAFYVTLSATATEPTAVTVCTAGETISDPVGVAYLVEGGCGTVDVDVEGIVITLDTDAGPIDQGGTGNINVVMDNPYPVYGLELHLQDLPESVAA